MKNMTFSIIGSCDAYANTAHTITRTNGVTSPHLCGARTLETPVRRRVPVAG